MSADGKQPRIIRELRSNLKEAIYEADSPYMQRERELKVKNPEHVIRHLGRPRRGYVGCLRTTPIQTEETRKRKRKSIEKSLSGDRSSTEMAPRRKSSINKADKLQSTSDNSSVASEQAIMETMVVATSASSSSQHSLTTGKDNADADPDHSDRVDAKQDDSKVSEGSKEESASTTPIIYPNADDYSEVDDKDFDYGDMTTTTVGHGSSVPLSIQQSVARDNPAVSTSHIVKMAQQINALIRQGVRKNPKATPGHSLYRRKDDNGKDGDDDKENVAVRGPHADSRSTDQDRERSVEVVIEHPTRLL
ncbi:MAG: hypothetical protein M1817_003016 [Caeruleum heppii]|nr:MAG: hypothetical protein M1817_003016 [Caeruleum heppii]